MEVENLFPGSSSPSYDFEVERVDVSISGTGARASFIGWGSYGLDVFPLQAGPCEQTSNLSTRDASVLGSHPTDGCIRK